MLKKRLAVIGAGPKGLAIATKAVVLKRLGYQTPEIVLIDRRGVASHWVADSGLTNGQQPLGTSPEKDVGFPYASFCWGTTDNAKVNRAMQEFSWSAFLIDVHCYSDWIDRGKPAPTHKRWAEYLRWAWDKIKDQTSLVIGRVDGASCDGEKWKLTVAQRDEGTTEIFANGLVLTGPGRPRMPAGLPNDDRILSTDRFWRNWEKYAAHKGARIAVVGTGETAACIAVAVAAARQVEAVDVISPLAMNYSRGESYVENHVYTDPFQSNWFGLTLENRRDFISRTDRGVFSVAVKKQLDEMNCLEIVPGRLTQVKVDSLNQLMATIQYAKASEDREYHYVIFATGFEPWAWFREILSPDTTEHFKRSLGVGELTDNAVELNIGESLALGSVRPALHLPMMAAVNQGPGYPNLSCLGRLSDQILSAYVPLD